MQNLPADYEPYNRVPEESGLSEEAESDLNLLDRIGFIIESIETEKRGYSKLEANVFFNSIKIRLNYALNLADNINNSKVRDYTKEAIEEWGKEDLVTEGALNYGLKGIHDIQMEIYDGEYDYD